MVDRKKRAVDGRRKSDAAISDMAATLKKKSDFLTALAETGNVSRACEISGACRQSIYRLRDSDEEFAAGWDKAKTIGVELLEDEAVRRAYSGVDEPVFHQGLVCGTVKKYSDSLLIFLLKGAKPEKYRDNHKIAMDGSMSIVVATGVADGEGA